MKLKILLVLLAAAMAFICGCETRPQVVEEKPAAVEEEEELEPIPLALPERILLDEPVEVTAYLPPEQKVAPLMSYYTTMSYVIDSLEYWQETVFIKDDLSRLELPDDAWYRGLEEYGDDISIEGYAIGDSDIGSGRYAIMDLAGNYLSDFSFYTYAYDLIASFNYNNGYLVVDTGAANSYNLNVFNFRTRELILEQTYYQIDLYDEIMVARDKDDNTFILDYAGKVLFQHDGWIDVKEESSEPYFAQSFSGSSYNYYDDLDELYYYAGEESVSIQDNIAVMSGKAERDGTNLLSIYLLDGKYLLSCMASDKGVFGNYVYAITDEGIYFVRQRGDFVLIPIQTPIYPKIISYDGQILEMAGGEWEKRYVYYFDKAGELTSKKPYETVYPQEYTQISDDYLIAYADGTCQLEDMQGNIIIPGGEFKQIDVGEKFIIAYESWTYNNDGNTNSSIFDLQGNLLLKNPLGTGGTFGDRLIVWLDDSTCVLLQTDGTYEYVPNPPQVKLRYQRYPG